MSRYDYLIEIKKFNPYHDSRGRFSTADSAASFTYRPGGSKAHDKAIGREKMSQNPYRNSTNEEIERKLNAAYSERQTALRRSRMTGSGSAITRAVSAAKKKLEKLNGEIKLLEQAQEYFEQHGNSNTF